jgi:hypothetical protein
MKGEVGGDQNKPLAWYPVLNTYYGASSLRSDVNSYIIITKLLPFIFNIQMEPMIASFFAFH